MIRISTIFIAICMVLVAASLGLVLHAVAGFRGTESAIVALTALTFLILYNAVSMRLRDRTDVGSQISDLSRGTADLARQVAEFGRRISENGSRGTDHGAASPMLAMGGLVRGGLYGTAASLNPDAANPTLENNGADVHFETDFRSVYAKVIDNWLGGDSVGVLGGNFRKPGLDFV